MGQCIGACRCSVGVFARDDQGSDSYRLRLRRVDRELQERILRPGPSSLKPLTLWTRARAHHSSVLRIFGSSSRGPHTTPMRRQSDGLAAIAPRQHSVRP